MEFCTQCGNVMVLKSKEGVLGTYVCRNCDSVQALPVEKLEIVENMTPEFTEPLLAMRDLGFY